MQQAVESIAAKKSKLEADIEAQKDEAFTATLDALLYQENISALAFVKRVEKVDNDTPAQPTRPSDENSPKVLVDFIANLYTAESDERSDVLNGCVTLGALVCAGSVDTLRSAKARHELRKRADVITEINLIADSIQNALDAKTDKSQISNAAKVKQHESNAKSSKATAEKIYDTFEKKWHELVKKGHDAKKAI
jgi:hypothetical protein